MANELTLTALSNQLADIVAHAAPSVVQVHGRRRPASGLVHGSETVLTTVRAIGREDHLHVRTGDGRTFEAELAGWDPTTGLAVLRTPGLDAPAIPPSEGTARVGQIAVAVARSWSNAVTASAGLVSVIGGPLPTGRHRAIEQVIRTSAPMHDGFAGGAFLDTDGRLLGVATAASIRGLGVVIPTAIAWRAATAALERETAGRGYIGLAGQTVVLPAPQAESLGRERALLVVGVTPDGPAAAAGLLVGDLVSAANGRPVTSPDDLLDVLLGAKIGSDVTLKVLRGGEWREATARVAERPKS